MMLSRHVLSVSDREMMTRPPMVLARRLSSTPTAPATVSPHILELDTSQHQFAHRFSNIVSTRKSAKATSTQQRLADNLHMLRLVVQRPDGIADATIDKLIRETVKLLNSSPPSSTDVLHLAWILCALRRPAELTTLSSLAQNTLTDPEFVVYFIRYLREANPRFDADHPFSTIARFLAAATGEADTLSDSTVQILVEEFVRSVPDGKIAAVPAQRWLTGSCLRSHHAWTPSSTLACLAALTEATGINPPQVVDKAMKGVQYAKGAKGCLASLSEKILADAALRDASHSAEGLRILADLIFTTHEQRRGEARSLRHAVTSSDWIREFFMKKQGLRPFKGAWNRGPSFLSIARALAYNNIDDAAFSEFMTSVVSSRHAAITTACEDVAVTLYRVQRSKQRALAFIKPRMLGLISAVWAIGTTHELRDRREFATAVEFIFTHPTLNVILPDKEEVFTARQLVQVAQMVSLRGVEQLTLEARSVMHRLLTSTERMNTFSVNEETQRRKHCSKLATLFECCIPDCKASCWVYQSGYHIDVVLTVPEELTSSSSSGKSAPGRGKLALGLWYLQPSQMHRTPDGKLLVTATHEFSREFLLRTSKDIDALVFVTRDEVDALLSNSRGQELTAWVGKALESNMKAMKGAALETAEREPPVPSKQLISRSRL
ncbi:hypothetical protein FOZ63_024334 [Perkinsus olseni]|uniref:Uncharacterized protein n=1 Tax=Perkinsus olseni TaxID=32597 RepID=A0A7J6S701_PEROL|nr:hypothetical protein FOZ63_024334 [Perkinsus olseni]